MFGSSTNTPFGTSTGFGTGNSCSSLFGGRFGQHASGASGSADKGTPVKFVVVQGNDSMVKNGITTNISVRHQCITVMSNYDKKSIEELRIEDYEAGRKTGGFSICTTTGSLFGNTSGTAFSTSSSLPGLQPAIRFGTPGSLFGSSPTNAVLFGQQQTTEGLGQNAGSQFGVLDTTGKSTATGFSFPAASAGFKFGTTQTTTSLLTPTTTGSLFGSSSKPAVLFGQQQTTERLDQNAGSLFGTPALSATGASIFGQSSSGQTGQPKGDQEVECKDKAVGSTGFTLLSTSTSKGGLFGNTSGTGFGASSSLFGQKPTTGFGATGGLFGSSSGTAVLFGQQQTAKRLDQNVGNLFGTPTSSTTGTSIFGQSSSGQTEQPKDDQEVKCKNEIIGSTGFTLLSRSTSNGGLFGNTSGTGFDASSSLFGQKPTTGFGATGSIFGSSSATAGLFGQQQTAEGFGQNIGSLFGTATLSTTGTSIFGQSSSGQTEQPTDDQEVECKNETIGSTGFTLLSTSTSKGGLFGNTSGTGFGTSSSLFGQKPTTGFGTTESLSVNSSTTTGEFGQEQTTEGFLRKADVLINTTSRATENGIKFATTTSSASELSTGLSIATSTSVGLSLPETKSTTFGCGQTQADTGELLEQTGLRLSQEQDDPPSLSPRFSLSEAMSEGMEELRKENESLRKVIKMYKESEKAIEELRRFYIAQASKHKENMEQAVSHKFLELVSKVRGLKTIRDATPEDGKTSHDRSVVIRETIDSTRNNRIDLESLKSLHQVQECESALQHAQECLRQCKDKEELLATDIVAQRDKARKDLYDSIDLFCQEVDLIPLQERENSLQHVLSQLQEQEGIYYDT